MFVPRMAVGPGTTPPIHSVFLIFQTPKDALDTLFVLEGWNLIYNLAEPLRARGKALAIEVSAVGRGDRGKGGEGLERLASKEARARRIDVVLRFLEGFEVPDVAYLRMLDIPHYLLVLARIDPLLIPDDVYYKLRARAHALLQSWKPLFMEEFEMRKWFRRGGGVVLGYMQSRGKFSFPVLYIFLFLFLIDTVFRSPYSLFLRSSLPLVHSYSSSTIPSTFSTLMHPQIL
ncbi:hypothetical protein BDQ17DRAFT_477636 [Cyathus striatus]|nr:hypothetical protein BDQ17DRAFT_477636 [Cyathus striatus]